MVLKKLILENYGPFLGSCEIDLAPRAPVGERPICLIGALNGAGKTSVLDAIGIALYGARARPAARTGLAWRDFLCAARHADSPRDERSVIELRFDEHGEGAVRTYRIRRSWHLTGTSASDQLNVIINGAYSQDETDLWPERAEELLPLGLSNLFFFDGEQVRSLAASELPTPEVRGAIAALLGLDLAAQLSQDLSAVSHRRRKDLVDQRTLDELATLEHRVEELTTRLVELREEQTRIQSELSAQRATLEAVDPGLHPAVVPEMDGPMDPEARRDIARGALVELAGGVLPLALVRDLVEDTLARARGEIEAVAQAQIGEHLERRDQRILTVVAQQDRQGSVLEALEQWFDEDRRARAGLAEVRPVLGASLEDLNAAESATGSQLNQALARARELSVMSRQAASEGRVSRVRAAREASTTADGPQLSEIELLLEIQTRLTRVRDQIAKEADELRRAAVERDRKLRRVTEQRIEEVESRRVVESAVRVQGLLSGFQRALVRRRVDELEQLTTDRIRLLNRKVGRVERVNIAPDTFALSLIGEGGMRIDRARLSAGEQQILAVAFLWALSDATGRDLPVVIDTPLARLDSVHRGRLIEDYFPKASHQVILLSTDTEIDEATVRAWSHADAIDHSLTLDYDPRRRSTTVRDGYFQVAQ